MVLPTELETRLRVFCARCRIYDFFKTFDKLTLKRIEPASAIRALDMAGLRLSPVEQGLVKAEFIDGHGMFDYGKFVTDFNDVKPSGFFERKPEEVLAATATAKASAFPVSPLDGGSAWFYEGPESDAEVSLYDSTMETVRKEVKTRGLVLKQSLRDFDAHRRGVVTVSRFQREITSCLPTLRPPQVAVLTKAYLSADKHDVRYMVFHHDATPSDGDVKTGVRGAMGTATSSSATAHLSGSPVSHRLGASASGTAPLASSSRVGGAGASSGSLSASASALGLGDANSSLFSHVKPPPEPSKTLEFKSVPSTDVSAVEAAIIRQVFERRIRVTDLFGDFDKTRRGVITRSQFLRGLTAAKLEGVSPSAMDAVAEKYRLITDATGNSIRWTVFAGEVEKAFCDTGLEKSPTKKPDSFAHTVVTAPHPRAVRPVLDEAASAALNRAVERIRHHIQTYRTYNVKAWLVSYDKAHEGMVTETQFLRVLAAFDLVPHAAEERTALLNYFRGVGIRDEMIDYRAFLADVYTDGVE